MSSGRELLYTIFDRREESGRCRGHMRVTVPRMNCANGTVPELINHLSTPPTTQRQARQARARLDLALRLRARSWMRHMYRQGNTHVRLR